MGNIKEVFYTEIEETIRTINDVGEYYYYFNLLGFDNNIDKEYEIHEMKQINARNSIIGNAIKNKEINAVFLNTSIIGISSIKNKPIIIADII